MNNDSSRDKSEDLGNDAETNEKDNEIVDQLNSSKSFNQHTRPKYLMKDLTDEYPKLRTKIWEEFIELVFAKHI